MHYRLSALLISFLVLFGSAEAQQRSTGPYIQVSPTPSKLSTGGPGFVQIDANGIASIAASVPGSGTVTNTSGALAINSMVLGNSGADVKTAGGTIGGAFTTAGPVTFANAAVGVTLQFPVNGPFNYVFPPASQTLASLAGSETLTNKIYSGGQLSGTFNGNPIFSGVPSFTGLSPGVQTRCLGLDSGNNLVVLNAGCGSGGGGSAWTLTDGTHTVAAVTQVTVTGGTVGGSTPNATLAIAAGGTVTQNGNLATNQIATGGTNGTTDIKTVTTGVNVLTALSTNVGSVGAFAKNNGDALSGTYTGAPTFSGTVTFSGIPKFTGLSGGTAVACLALDGVNSTIAVNCPSGGSGTVNTAGANAIAYYPALGNTISGFGPLTNGQLPCGSTGSAPVPCTPTAGTPNLVIATSAGGLSISATSPINDISGSGTAIVTGDNTKLDKLGAFTYTLAQAGTAGFSSGWSVCLFNIGASNATINGTTSTFIGAGGSTTLVLAPGAWACPTSDGTNYQTPTGNDIIAGAGTTITRNANGTMSVDTSLLHNAPADGGSHSYTILSSDLAKEVDLVSTFTAAVVPQATGSFAAGAAFKLCPAGAITATSTTSTINGIAGATGLKLGANGCSDWASDGTNWKVTIGSPTPATQNNTTVVATDGSIITPGGGSGFGAWAAYTPSLSCNTGSFTTATPTGRWSQDSSTKTVFVSINLAITNHGSCSNPIIGLPAAIGGSALGARLVCIETAATGKMGTAAASSGSTLSIGDYVGGEAAVDGQTWKCGGSYEGS